MKRKLVMLAGLASLLPTLAVADICKNCVVYYEPHGPEGRHEHHRHARVLTRQHQHWRQRQRHASYYDKVRARVVDVQPVYHYREQHNGYHSCIRRDSGRAGYRSWTPAVLGAVIGGAVGHSLGDSYGDADAAAIAGGVLGAAVGRDVGRHHAQAGAISSSGPCRVSARDSAWRRPVEYVVTYRYNGQIYRTRMEHHPGEWVELDADKRPT